MQKHSDRLESLTLHILGLFLALITIVTAFLTFGIYQTQMIEGPSQLTVQAATNPSTIWTQNSFSGGESSSNYIVNWSSPSWNKYNSGTNVSISGNKIVANSAGASFLSTIYSAGSNYKFHSVVVDGPNISVQARTGNSLSEINSAAFVSTQTGFCATYKGFVQVKVTFSSPGDFVDYIYFVKGNLSLYGSIKSSTTGADIPGAVATVVGKGVNDTNQLREGSYYNYILGWDYLSGDPSSYTINASANGYNSQTKTVSFNFSNCTNNATTSFSLTPINSSGSSTSKPITTNSSTSSTVTAATFQTTQLPSIFTIDGAATTDLSKVADPTNVKDFKLEVLGKNSIEYEENLNLSSQNTVNALKTLDNYVKISKIGTVEIDSKSLPALNRKAKITMFGLTNFVATPAILVDGNPDTNGVVRNISFDQKTGTLSFNVAHFTIFTAIPGINITYPASTTIKTPLNYIKGTISDPKATLTGTFNGQEIKNISVDPKTGEFTIFNLNFKQGSNALKLSADSRLGTIPDLNWTIIYSPKTTIVNKLVQNPLVYTLVIILLLAALLFSILLWHFLRKKRQRLELSSG